MIKMNNKIDIIIPVFNEGTNIISTLESIFINVKNNFTILICYDFVEDNTLSTIQASKFNKFENIKFIKNIIIIL